MNLRWTSGALGAVLGYLLVPIAVAEFDFSTTASGTNVTKTVNPQAPKLSSADSPNGEKSPGLPWLILKPAQALSTLPGDETKSLVLPVTQSARVVADTPTQEEYRIGASDLLEISVFQVKELDRTVRVNARGLVALPLIGQIAAAGLTATELEERIAAKLSENYLQDPQVTIFIKEFTSQRITVEGQVIKAGIYPISGQTTLLQALALSGGINRVGDKNISIFRLAADGKRMMLSLDIDDVRDGKQIDPVMKNNDIIVVGTNEIRNFVETIRGFISLGTLGF